jgi:hypothetical protein
MIRKVKIACIHDVLILTAEFLNNNLPKIINSPDKEHIFQNLMKFIGEKLWKLQADKLNHSSSQKAEIIQNPIHDFPEDDVSEEDDQNDYEEDEYDDDDQETKDEKEEYYFLELCSKMMIVLITNLRNVKKIQEYEMVKCNCFIKEIPKLKIKNPSSFVVINKFKYHEPIIYHAQSKSNNPNEFDDERFMIKEWWNDGFNEKEINSKLAIRRKNYFSWQFRYDMITTKLINNTMQQKISFLNAHINHIPQSEAIMKDNIERLIERLKEEDLYKEWQDELDEFLEFEKFYNDVKSLKISLLNTENQFDISTNNYLPFHFNYPILKSLNFDHLNGYQGLGGFSSRGSGKPR